MEDYSIPVIYDNTEFRLSKVPATYSQLKKEVQKLIPLPDCYLFLIVNSSGSKFPVTTSKAYLRAISISRCTSIELVCGDSSQEIDFAPTTSAFSLNKNRALLSKKKNNLNQETIEEIPENEMCMICYDRLKAPLSAKCGHICCKSCWEKALKNFLECPMCKARVRLSQLREV